MSAQITSAASALPEMADLRRILRQTQSHLLGRVLMFCCACAGSCNHVGAHSYCAAHGGSPYQPPMQTTTNTTVLPPIVLPTCEHCYCIHADDYAGSKASHRRCCKCRTVMAEEFLKPESVKP